MAADYKGESPGRSGIQQLPESRMKAANLDKAREYLSRLNAICVFRNEVLSQSGGEARVKIQVNGNSCDFSKLAIRHVQTAIEDEEKMILNTLEILGVEIDA